MFLGLPDRWQEKPKFRCASGHISTTILKSEVMGDLCLKCQESCQLTFPEDCEGSALGAEVFALRMHTRRELTQSAEKLRNMVRTNSIATCSKARAEEILDALLRRQALASARSFFNALAAAGAFTDGTTGRCTNCMGHGTFADPRGGGFDTCCACGGTGSVPLPEATE